MRAGRAAHATVAMVAAFVTLASLAGLTGCGGSSQATPSVKNPSPTLSLGPTSARFAVEVRRGPRVGRALVTLEVTDAERGELLAWLQIADVTSEGEDAAPGVGAATALVSPLSGLEGVGFRWRMSPRGTILAAGGPAASSSRVSAAALQRALDFWILVSATVPNLPDGPIHEGDHWPALQRTEVVGGGAERVVLVGGTWRLARILSGAPALVVLEGDLRLEARDPALAAEAIEPAAKVIAARAVVYVNLERRAVDFVTVASDSFSWQARRL
jgi:hypothetical protein